MLHILGVLLFFVLRWWAIYVLVDWIAGAKK